RLLPELAATAAQAPLQDGVLSGSFGATLELPRRVGHSIDLAGGFGLEARLDELALRSAPDGPVYAGVDEVLVEARKIVPGGPVHLSLVEIVGIRGEARRTAAGLEFLGVTWQLPEPAGDPTAEPAAAAAADRQADVGEQDAAAEHAAEPAGDEPAELRLDRFAVHDIDFRLRDDTTEPPTLLPITGLDVEVTGLSSRATL